MLFARQPYTLYKNGAQVAQGVLDEDGRVTVENAEKGARYQVKLTNGALHEVPVARERMEPDASKDAYHEHHLSNQGYRADGGSTSKRQVQKARNAGQTQDSSQ